MGNRGSETRIPAATAVTDILWISALVCVTLAVTNPIGGFPLNDDWSYSRTVKRLVEMGEFRPTGWLAVSLLSQALWGALFSLPAGFSFTALRFSTLTLSLAGVACFYVLVREVQAPRFAASLAALTLAFSPLYFVLSHTFMTDVPFAVMALMASLGFVRHLKTGSIRALVTGILLSVAATLTRQPGLSVPLAFGAVCLLRRGLSKRSLLTALTPAFACLASLLVYQYWMQITDRAPALYLDLGAFAASLTVVDTTSLVIVNAYMAAVYVGLFLLPLVAARLSAAPDVSRRTQWRVVAASAGTVALGALAVVVLRGPSHLLMPIGGNVLAETGLGPLLLRDVELLELPSVPPLPAAFWLGVTVVAVVGAVLLLAAVFLRIADLAPSIRTGAMGAQAAAVTFLLSCAAVYLIPLLANRLYDRYLIAALPLIGAGLSGGAWAAGPSRASARAVNTGAAILLCATTVFSVCGTRDYLSWNRTRWKALHALMSQQVRPSQIDGGFEFNGWYLYDTDYEPRPGRSWWWVRGDTYRLGFGLMPGYSVVKTYTYRQWLPPRVGTIVVQKRDGE